ncbi:hypothetical protein R1flu_009687 [Riccia fluitans]|uniref:YDG domain-containing protein n=1 Tax=Riccia fluitans TaxID=41844 RepID=A0ABD1Z308_9MARC
MSTSHRFDLYFGTAGDRGSPKMVNRRDSSLVWSRLDQRFAAEKGEVEEGDIGPRPPERDEKWRRSLLRDTGESRESFKYLCVNEESENRGVFSSGPKSVQEFAQIRPMKQEPLDAAPPPTCVQMERRAQGTSLTLSQACLLAAGRSQATFLSPSAFDREETRLLQRRLETLKQGVTANYLQENFTADDNELEDGEIGPYDTELEEAETDAKSSEPDEMRTEAFLPPSAGLKEMSGGRKESESEGGHSLSSPRTDEGAGLKRVKKEPLEAKEGEDVDMKRFKERALDVKNERVSKCGLSSISLRMDKGVKMKPVKEEPVDVVPPPATVTEAVTLFDKVSLNLPILDDGKEPYGETFRQRGKRQECFTHEKQHEESSDNSTSKPSPVVETLKIFAALEKHFQYEAKDSRRTSGKQPAIMRAAGVMNENNLSLPGDIIGEIEGIEVGRRFSSRGEVSVIGLHRELQKGINVVVMKDSAHDLQTTIGTSIVFGLGDKYPDNKIGLGENDVSIYSGEGGRPSKKKRDRNKDRNAKGLDESPRYTDQKLTGGNLALVNSFKLKIPIRVIKGLHKGSGIRKGIRKGLRKGLHNSDNKKYVYDGLYQIIDVQYQRGVHGNNVYKFFISRLP